ncbi:hypothetical protein Tco_1262039 [Tanacetum coccineum]
METSIISISSDVSVESVGSSFPRIILIGSVSVEVPVASKVGAAAVPSPARVLELDTHSSSEADPSESSPPPVSIAPMVSPFLCSDDSKSDTEMPERHDIPISQLYRTHLGRPCRALTARKSVRPLPYHHLGLRYTSHHLDHFTSGSSSGHSSSDHSSSGHSILGHSLPGHASPDTIVADSSTPPRFCYPPLARTPRYSETYLNWRSPAATVTSSIHATRALVPSRVDLLPRHKRFRDSISPKDNVEEDINVNVLADIETDATANEVAVDRGVEAGVDACIGTEFDVGVDVEDEVEDEVESSDKGTIEVGVDVVTGIDIPDGMLMPDVVERLEQVEEGLQDIYEHVIKISLQRIEDIKTGYRELENMTITRSSMTSEEIEELVNRRVEEALAAYEATRAANALEDESQSQNSSDGDNGNGGDGNGGDGNGENGNGGNGNPNENNRGARPVARECTYQDFMKCQPLNFKGTEGVVGLIRWFKKMETVFHISNCQEKYQVKYATCTLLNSTLNFFDHYL